MRLMGLDVGGTSTRVVVCTPEGQLLGVGRAAGGNPRSSVGDPAENLTAAIAEAGARDVTVVGVGAAGTGSARRAEIVAMIGRALSMAGVTAPSVTDTDFGIAFRAAAPGPNGRLLLSGTGAVAARFEAWELTQRHDGLGWLLGDTGSGSWIGREAMRAVAAALDGRAPSTRLTEPVLRHFGVLDLSDACQGLVRATDGTRPAQWAGVTPIVFAQEDDPVAAGILDQAARALLDALAAAGQGPIVLAGGVLQGGPLRRRVETEVGPCEHATFPVVGACALAAAQAGSALDRRALTAALHAAQV